MNAQQEPVLGKPDNFYGVIDVLGLFAVYGIGQPVSQIIPFGVLVKVVNKPGVLDIEELFRSYGFFKKSKVSLDLLSGGLRGFVGQIPIVLTISISLSMMESPSNSSSNITLNALSFASCSTGR